MTCTGPNVARPYRATRAPRFRHLRGASRSSPARCARQRGTTVVGGSCQLSVIAAIEAEIRAALAGMKDRTSATPIAAVESRLSMITPGMSEIFGAAELGRGPIPQSQPDLHRRPHTASRRVHEPAQSPVTNSPVIEWRRSGHHEDDRAGLGATLPRRVVTMGQGRRLRRCAVPDREKRRGAGPATDASATWSRVAEASADTGRRARRRSDRCTCR